MCFIDIVLFFKINQAVLLSKVLRIICLVKKNYTCTLKLENLIIHGYPLSVLRAVYKSACTNAKFKGSLQIAMPITMVKISDCSLNQYATCSTYKIIWSKRLVGETLWNAQFSQRITCFVYSFWLIRISGLVYWKRWYGLLCSDCITKIRCFAI